MNMEWFAVFSTMQFVLLVFVLVLMANEKWLIAVENKIRAVFSRKPHTREHGWVTKVINDFYR